MIFRTRRAALALALLVVVVGSAPGQAQAAPALDRWFPIRVGSEWGYLSTDGGTRSRVAVRDSVVSGRRYVVVAETDRDGSGEVLAERLRALRFDGVAGLWVGAAGGVEQPDVSFSPCPLVPGPLESVNCRVPGGGSEIRQVTEGPGTAPVDGETRDVATRTYASETGFDVSVYADGVGPLLFSEGGVLYALKTFRPAPPAPSSPSLASVRAWPNPSVGPVTLSYAGGPEGPLAAEVVDALGRRVSRVELAPAPGTATVELPSVAGVYVVRILGPEGEVGAVQIVRVR